MRRISDDDESSSSSDSEVEEGPSGNQDVVHNEEEDLPIHERIRRKEALGLTSLSEKRERKRSALEVASQRLAQYKESKNVKDDVKTTPSSGDAPKKKKSKHAPTEVSSKRHDFFARGAPRLNESGLGVEIGARRYKPLDPRTSSLSGHLNEEQFEKNYEFLQDMRTKEISQLKKQISAWKKTGQKGQRLRRQLGVDKSVAVEELEDRMRKLKQEKADFERRKIERAAKKSVKRKIQSEVEEGKRGAYFLKRKEKKKLEFEAKMEELRKRGGKKAVEKALSRRRQKAKSRDAGIFARQER